MDRAAIIKAAGQLRAAGALQSRAGDQLEVPVYKALTALVPDATEAELKAAEDEALAAAFPPPASTASAAAAPATIPVSAVFLAAAQAAAAAGARTSYYTPEQAAALAAAKPQQLGWRDGGMDGSIPYRFYSDIRVDSVVPAGTPGTVTMPVTGHVLSLPKSGVGELFMGYCERVCQQATNGQFEKFIGSVAALLIGGGVGATADAASWPEAADRFFNLRAYMTPEERAAADAAWAGYTMQKRP